MVDPTAAASSLAGTKGETQAQEPTRNERTIARRSAEARAVVPDLELTTEVDARAAIALQRKHSCSITAILVRACALALREFPRANGAYRDGHFEFYSRVNVGVVTVTDDAYLIPTVFDADRKPLDELNAEIEALSDRARQGKLAPPELAGGTFTVADFGAYGVGSVNAVINPSQAAALSAGATREVPVVRDGAIVPGCVMTLTLACDHRILHGAQAARFLARVDALIAEGRL